MVTRIKVFFALVAVILALIGTIKESTIMLALMYFFLGLLFLTIGSTELKKERKIPSILMILLAGFFIIGSIYIMIFEL
ncbi:MULTISPECIES: DUF3953 domain-containing protein [unclassified Niallia]|uniref:DUF3953 domain-containing protein n=1 Tax=Niallia TaxID=2837506 RepID=UPI001EDC7FCA|nr:MULTISPECIES: DUF3953 domain-containing protein [unclassified Niallia]MCM3033981.1 DUF3953 domain-containing protein [Niallia sp. MER 6]UPO90069.1 DUF3953 domain-containing protein [Niallia sp. Man26]